MSCTVYTNGLVLCRKYILVTGWAAVASKQHGATVTAPVEFQHCTNAAQDEQYISCCNR